MANRPFNRRTFGRRSARYRRASGSIADLVPFWRVFLNVALACSWPIFHCSERVSAVIVKCRSVETKVRRAGTSSKPRIGSGVVPSRSVPSAVVVSQLDVEAMRTFERARSLSSTSAGLTSWRIDSWMKSKRNDEILCGDDAVGCI